MLLSVFMFCHEAFTSASRNQRRKTTTNDLLPVPIPKTFRKSIRWVFRWKFSKKLGARLLHVLEACDVKCNPSQCALKREFHARFEVCDGCEKKNLLHSRVAQLRCFNRLRPFWISKDSFQLHLFTYVVTLATA